MHRCRYVLRDWVAKWAAQHPKWLALEDALEEQGWSLVLLLRAAPFVPCVILNYTLPLTSVRRPPSTAASGATALCETTGEPIEQSAELIGEPIERRIRRALRTALIGRTAAHSAAAYKCQAGQSFTAIKY